MTLALRLVVAVGMVVSLLVAPAVVVADDVEHEHPDDVDETSDLAGTERWLGNRMGQIHANCTNGIEVGNFDACEDLDEEYESMLDRYVTVERERTGETTTSEEFDETRDKQQEYAQQQAEFNRTLEEYREASAAGNNERARELARELARLAERIQVSGGQLETNFRELDPSVETDLVALANTTNESTREVQQIVMTIQQESFIETTITADVDPRASYADPATVTGRVVTENGTAVSESRIIVTDGEQRYVTRTDTDGEFRLEYSPVRTATGDTTLTVTYSPNGSEPYLGSDTTVTMTVWGTESSVEINNHTATAGFGDRVVVEGLVNAANKSVSGVPVTVFLGDVAVGTARTDRDGRFVTDFSLPVSVPVGDNQLTARASSAGRAIIPSRDATALEVEETGSDLNVTATAQNEEVSISGRLAADSDIAVGERPITIHVGETTYERTTDADGRFALTIDAGAANETVVAQYDETPSNLASSRAETSFEYDESSSSQGESDGLLSSSQGESDGLLSSSQDFLSRGGSQFMDLVRNNPIIAGAIGLAVVVSLVVLGRTVGARWRRRRNGSGSGTAEADVSGESTAGSEAEPSPTAIESLLDVARSHIEPDPDTAVRTSYTAVRSELGTDNDPRTHWEFYNDLEADLNGRGPALRSLTEAFEQAAFAASETDTERARTALENAEYCLESAGRTTD